MPSKNLKVSRKR